MQVESLIKLLSETLKFYADEKNYSRGIVDKDGGYQARHTLKIVSDNGDIMNNYEKLFEEFEQKADEAITPEDVIKLIGDLKQNNPE